ncbi:MAG: hypothetical protein FWC41_05130 [Firmicutes bacterium]|nr:hypothetical protein [Bacillota bacterium]
MLFFGNKNFDRKIASLLAVVATFAGLNSSVKANKTHKKSKVTNTKVSEGLTPRQKNKLIFSAGVVSSPFIWFFLNCLNGIVFPSSGDIGRLELSQLHNVLTLFDISKDGLSFNKHNYYYYTKGGRSGSIINDVARFAPFNVIYMDTEEKVKSHCKTLSDICDSDKDLTNDQKNKIIENIDKWIGLKTIDDKTLTCGEFFNSNVKSLLEKTTNVSNLTNFVKGLLGDKNIGKNVLTEDFNDNVLENIAKHFKGDLTCKVKMLALLKSSVSPLGKEMLGLEISGAKGIASVSRKSSSNKTVDMSEVKRSEVKRVEADDDKAKDETKDEAKDEAKDAELTEDMGVGVSGGPGDDPKKSAIEVVRKKSGDTSGISGESAKEEEPASAVYDEDDKKIKKVSPPPVLEEEVASALPTTVVNATFKNAIIEEGSGADKLTQEEYESFVGKIFGSDWSILLSHYDYDCS